jgi:hypothetical protein
MPQAGSGPTKEVQIPVWPTDMPFRWHQYLQDPAPCQLYSVMFGQLHEGLLADPVVAKGFNCSLTACENVDVSNSVVPIYILNHACLTGIHLPGILSHIAQGRR